MRMDSSQLINGWCKHNIPLTSCKECGADITSEELQQLANVFKDGTSEFVAVPRRLLRGVLVALTDARFKLETERRDAISTVAQVAQKLMPQPHCRGVWRAGVLRSPDQPPDGARCVLAPHGEEVPHEFESTSKKPQTPPAPQRPTIGRVLHITEYREMGFGKHDVATIFPAIVYRVTDDQMDVAAFSPEACGIQLKGLHPTEPGLITLIEHTDGVHHSYSRSYSWDWPPRAS